MEDLIFSFYPTFYEFAHELPAKARLAFYDAILDYFFEEKEPSPEIPPAARSAFSLVRKVIDASKRRKRASRNGGLKGGASKARPGNQNARKMCGENASKTQASIKDKVEVKVKRTPQDPPAGGFDARAAFDEFWKAYPSECPRKTDKKKCAEKYARLMRDSKDPAALHRTILDGLGVWKRCDTWTKDGGQFIRAPLVWLNSENWNDSPLADESAIRSPEEADALEAMRRANAMSAAAAQEGGQST